MADSSCRFQLVLFKFQVIQSLWWPVPGKAPHLWAPLYSLADKGILKWNNLFWPRVTSKHWLPGETERCSLQPCGIYTPSLWTSQQKEPHPINTALLLLRNKHSQHSLCCPSSWAAQQHPGLLPTSTLGYAQPDTDVSRPWLALASPALLRPCMVSNRWQSVTVPASRTVCRQQGGAAEACPMLSPLCPFLVTQDWGHPVFQETGKLGWLLQKSWCK